MFLHGKIEIFIDREDPVDVGDFISIGAIADRADKDGAYDTWRCRWFCQTRKELVETLQKIHAELIKEKLANEEARAEQ